MLTVHDADELGEFVGIHSTEVVVLMDVGPQVIKERLALTDHEFPIALPHTDDLRSPVAHLPIEKVMLPLLPIFSKQSRTE